MTAAGVFALVAVALWSLIFLAGLRGIRSTPVLQACAEHTAEVDAYVPARDEQEIIEACVQGALSQAQLRTLVVVDDRSSDDTADILARIAASQPRLRVLSGQEPPLGHCGKPAALVHATQEVRPEAEWLLFLDADVVLAPGALGGLLRHAEAQEVDLLTVIPRMTLGTPMERLVMPAVGALILAHHPPAKVNDPNHAKAFANGQVLLVRAEAYQAVGGHGAVVREVLEDVALARRLKAAGRRLRVVDGRNIATTRMYRDWPELVEGWTKNLFLLMDQSVSTSLGWAAASVVLSSLGWVALGWQQGVLGLGAWAGITAMQGTLRSLGGAPARYALLSPLGTTIAAGLLMLSVYQHRWGKGVRWKGRSYPGDAQS